MIEMFVARINPRSLFASLLFLTLAGSAFAQVEDGPPTQLLPSYKASPDIYKVLAENDFFRVILATWQPGQTDNWHYHEGALANYRLTDCKLKPTFPNGDTEVRETKKGGAAFNPAITHRVKNVGDSECILLIVERK